MEAGAAGGAAFTRALAQTGIVAWEGIGDAKGKPVDPDKEAIEQLLELWPAFDAVDRLYVGPALTRLDGKSLIALAEWHFDGGESYCAACPGQCAGSPY